MKTQSIPSNYNLLAEPDSTYLQHLLEIRAASKQNQFVGTKLFPITWERNVHQISGLLDFLEFSANAHSVRQKTHQFQIRSKWILTIIKNALLKVTPFQIEQLVRNRLLYLGHFQRKTWRISRLQTLKRNHKMQKMRILFTRNRIDEKKNT